jgi:pentatricopeptide repeat protein
MEEDLEAVAFDEALDSAQQVEHHEPGEPDEPPQTQQVDVNAKQRVSPLLLSPRDKAQLEIVRSISQRGRTNFAKASADFISWKRLLKEVSNPESKSPSSIELRMHHGVLALDSVNSMATFLSYSSPDHKQKARNRILLYTTLRHAPEKGAMVLKALSSVSRLPFYMIEDSLGFLAYHLRQMEPAMKQHSAQMLADLIAETAQLRGEGYIRPTQNTIYSILAALPPTRLEDWFHQLMAHEVPLHKYTLLQFASRLAKMPGTKDLSLDIWRDLCETGSLDINTPLGASFCTSLLAFKDDDLHALDENLATPAELFQSLLDLGLIPNVITYTTIIHSLCVKKDLQTAMKVFEVMTQHGVQPDKFTYSVMINGFKSCGDFATMLRIASTARAAGIQDAVVWNDMIHATFLACLKEPRVPGGVRRARCVVWGPMNAIFTRFFNPVPMRTLITEQFIDVRDFMKKQGFIPSRMRGAFHEIQQLHPQELIQPTSSTLSLMILGFVRHLPRPNDVVHFYDHFKKLLREGNPVAQSIVQEQGSIVHDIVLRSMLKWKGTLRIMLSIIRDMMTDIQPSAADTRPLSLQSSGLQISDYEPDSAANIEDPAVDSNASRPEADTTTAADHVTEAEGEAAGTEEAIPATALSNAGEHHGEARPPIRHPRPSVHTWSILLKAFMSNRLPQEAEHILKLMQVHGVNPNIVTWNTLAAGYAKQGDTKQAVEAMRRLEAAGFTSDDWTMRAFSYIRDKAQAIRLMEQKVEENKLTKAAVEGSGQPQGDEDPFDKIIGHETEVEEDGLSPYYEQAMGIAPEDDQWLPREKSPSTGKETQPAVQDSGRVAGEPQHEEPQKPVAKAPAPTKPDLGAWDDLLWDHAAESGPEEQGTREEPAA